MQITVENNNKKKKQGTVRHKQNDLAGFWPFSQTMEKKGHFL